MTTNAIQQLITKAREAQRLKYKNLPDYAIPMPRYNDTTANALTRAVLAWLQLNGHKAWRQNSTGRYRQGREYTDWRGRKMQEKGMFIPGQSNGAGDVSSIINGKFCSWEIKQKDKQSDAQKQFQASIQQSGGKYFLIRSFDEFMKEYRNLIN